MLQVCTIFTKLGNVDFTLAKNGKGCQQIVKKMSWDGSNHFAKFSNKSFHFTDTFTKVFVENL
jgi:hypothetical protein